MVIDEPAFTQMFFHDALSDFRSYVAIHHGQNALDAHLNERFGEAQAVKPEMNL